MQYLVFGYDLYYPSGGPHDFIGCCASPEDFDPLVWTVKRRPEEWDEEDDPIRYWEAVVLSCLKDGELTMLKAYRVDYNDYKKEFTVREIDPERSGHGG